jgi:hypothetical protein
MGAKLASAVFLVALWGAVAGVTRVRAELTARPSVDWQPTPDHCDRMVTSYGMTGPVIEGLTPDGSCAPGAIPMRWVKRQPDGLVWSEPMIATSGGNDFVGHYENVQLLDSSSPTPHITSIRVNY